MTFDELLTQARKICGGRQIARNAWVGSVSAALLSDKNNVYTGVCIDVCSGMGFCAEHAAIAAMITAGESRILKIVAVNEDKILSPCGRCREFISQINDNNMGTEVMISPGKIVRLRELLPFNWDKEN